MSFEVTTSNNPLSRRVQKEQRGTPSERVLEDAFLTIVQKDILDDFSEALEEGGFSPDQEHEFRDELSKLALEDLGGVLSMPYELRQTRIPKLLERIDSGMSVHDVVELLAREGRERGFRIGYHMSNADIQPRVVRGRGATWLIDGRERDHRDNDLPMAYYSTSFRNLYGKKKARFLYIVRAETGKDTTHKQDNDGAWGRATKLDIVGRLDYEKVMSEARTRADDLAPEERQ